MKTESDDTKETGYCWNEACLYYGIPKTIAMTKHEEWLCQECGMPTYQMLPAQSVTIYGSIENGDD
jgi:hypothetical protein